MPCLRLRLPSRRRPRFVRGHCLSVFCSTADSRSVFAIRFAPRISATCCAMRVFWALPCALLIACAIRVIKTFIAHCCTSRRYASQCLLASLREMPGMRRSEAEGWIMFIVWSACQGAGNVGGAVWSACGSVGSTGPTVLPIRKEPLALAYDPLDNRKIAFGVVRFALRRFP